jgi:hypothetical protein
VTNPREYRALSQSTNQRHNKALSGTWKRKVICSASLKGQVLGREVREGHEGTLGWVPLYVWPLFFLGKARVHSSDDQHIRYGPCSVFCMLGHARTGLGRLFRQLFKSEPIHKSRVNKFNKCPQVSPCAFAFVFRGIGGGPTPWTFLLCLFSSTRELNLLLHPGSVQGTATS